jgi:nucleoside-diphosphate-sugar epimerase
MRVLLAGGAGFIGSHLADALLARGDTVVALDNLVSGREQNVVHLAAEPRFELVLHDITEPLPGLGRFDVVMNFASPASPSDFERIPLEILAVGSAGTRHLLELAVAHGARFHLASTSEVYGDPLVHPQPEGYWGNVDSIGPRSCYDEAKRYSEALTMAYHRTKGLDVRIVRIFNTYGERMRPDDGRVVTNFIVQALRSEPITLYGDGTQTRSFCHVDDQVSGQLAVLDGDHGRPVNVGNPVELTMRELADLVVELTESASPIITVPLPARRAGDPSRRCPDISLVTSRFGWEPAVPIRDGLRRMIAAIAAELRVPAPDSAARTAG